MFRVILAAADAQNPKSSKKVQPQSSLPKVNKSPISTGAVARPAAPMKAPTQDILISRPVEVLPPKNLSTPTSPPTQAKKDQVAPALNIISEESGIALSDLTDDSVFSDIGVDSLLS